MGLLGKHRGMAVRELEQVFGEGSVAGLTDGQLLERFLAASDQTAFSTLVSRHGPMVLGVCRRILGTPPDADDAFQATFLVLVRRATALQNADSLGPWLYGVAWRVALRARRSTTRRRREEGRAAGGGPKVAQCDGSVEQAELRAVLDDEIHRLPEKYRRPVVLCCLEGLAQEDAARRLRWKPGVLRGRLDRARVRLRDRLARRGFAPGASLALVELLDSTTQSSVPPALLEATLSVCGASPAGKLTTGAFAGSVATLAGHVIRRQFLIRCALVVALLTTSTVALAALFCLAGPGSSGNWFSVGSQPEQVAPTTAMPIPPAGRTIELNVVDQTAGKPLAGVRLEAFVGTTRTGDQTTGATGSATFDYPLPRPRMMYLAARKPGFTPMIVWVRHPPFEEEFPAVYTLAMAPVTPVSGIVKDEEGRPVAGAKVSPAIVGSQNPPRPEQFKLKDNLLTDARGRWNCSDMPSGHDPARLWLRIDHPDFQPFEGYGAEAEGPMGPKDAVVLKRGIVMLGRVVDRQGRPVRGAQLSAGRYGLSPGWRLGETDENGRFRCGQLSPGETAITAQAKGHGPGLIKVDVRPGLPPVDIELGARRTIQGRVVDPHGKPLPGVHVRVDAWRGFRTLDWKGETDAGGQFRWDDAPRDPVWITAYGDGVISVNNREVPAAEAETKITMNQALLITGTVTGAGKRQPIEAFTLTPGTDRQDGSTAWDGTRSRQGRRGRFEIQITEPAEYGHRVRIDAAGYAPRTSRLITDGEGNVRLSLDMQASESITGVVRSPGGQPLAGADVVLVIPSEPIYIKSGQPPAPQLHRVVKTGADGRYSFPLERPPFVVLTFHDRGFAQTRVTGAARAGDLVLEPWGRVEGTLRLGTRLGAGLPLLLTALAPFDTSNLIFISFDYSTTADESGRFVFDRVIPGPFGAGRRLDLSGHSYTLASTTRIEVKPGRTTHVDLGGTGRPVVGHVVVPEGLRERVDWAYSINRLTPRPSMWNDFMRRLGMGGQAPGVEHAVRVEPNGSMRVEDVAAGTYELTIQLHEAQSTPNQPTFAGELIGTASRLVTVPEMPGGRSDDPLDLGEIMLVPVPPQKIVKVSDPAPPFRVETLDGKTIDLAEYRGKYVLLDFWATWCGPCREETPYLKAAFDAFGQDSHFTMIGLSLDRSKDAPRSYAEKNGLRWAQGFLGDWKKTQVPDAYGVSAIPAIWLIGPDGRVVAKDLRRGGIKKAIALALGRE